MQKLLNKKLLIPASLSILVIFIVILYKLGFRITYAPKLKNDWEAVSAVAAWFGVISSFVAIWCTIQVPNKIAKQQNKIELFQRRYELYTILKKCILLEELLRTFKRSMNSDMFQSFVVQSLYPDTVYNLIEKKDLYFDMLYCERKTKEILSIGKFLFDFETEIYLQPLSTNIHNILSSYGNEDYDEYFREYQKSIEKIKKELIPLIESNLKLE